MREATRKNAFVVTSIRKVSAGICSLVNLRTSSEELCDLSCCRIYYLALMNENGIYTATISARLAESQKQDEKISQKLSHFAITDMS